MLFPEDTDEIIIIVKYKVKVVPFLPGDITFNVTQSATTKGWLTGDKGKIEKVVASGKNDSSGDSSGVTSSDISAEINQNETRDYLIDKYGSGTIDDIDTAYDTSKWTLDTWEYYIHLYVVSNPEEKDFPDYNTQKSFLNGKEVPYGTKGSVRPDFYKGGSSVDIKNYNVESASGRSNLARNIEKQYYQRITHLPNGTSQSVMIDIRGQDISESDLSALYDDIMKRSNNGMTIIFKRD